MLAVRNGRAPQAGSGTGACPRPSLAAPAGWAHPQGLQGGIRASGPHEIHLKQRGAAVLRRHMHAAATGNLFSSMPKKKTKGPTARANWDISSTCLKSREPSGSAAAVARCNYQEERTMYGLLSTVLYVQSSSMWSPCWKRDRCEKSHNRKFLKIITHPPRPLPPARKEQQLVGQSLMGNRCRLPMWIGV